MNNYKEYIKCGEILISPSLNYKEQYILKCSECKEYYFELEAFLNHSIIHYAETEMKEQCLDDNNEVTVIKSEYASDIEVRPSSSADKVESISQKTTCHTYTEEADEEYMQDEQLIDYPESDDEFKDSEDSKSSIFVTNFMKSEAKVKAFIASYKNQPYLWNSKLPKRTRTKERSKDLQQIATGLKEQMNLQITSNQVASVIRRLRLKYREQLKILKSNGEYEDTFKDNTQGFLEHLHFLKPFMENNSVVKLDSLQPELAPEQIIQILGIYKRFPNLWNTNLIENCCTNKRLEALGQMEIVVKSEMGLKIHQNTLKRYIRCIHHHFTREKRHEMSNVKTTEDISEFYKHMTFLSDHVGPFKCCECRREFKSPLASKVHKSQHDGSIPLQCSMCKKDYKTTEAYMSHARKHMNDLKHQCNECGKKFLKLTELEIHTRSHTGIKPFCCELCGASFRHNHAFATHKRRHEKKYLHNCPICSKGFYKKDHLDNHLRTHGILQDFVCETCGKGFKSNKTLQQHELKHEVVNTSSKSDD